ncbi:hypothetical protein [Desulfovibrio subterraneus]|uniref:Alpha-L-arabinofuranosidase C-terminal domain-containing protein n=1 Tax=Desulfovibrio subterraneus TaxID=2718620 RepID=A0A7J0BLD2_9BACT|nr:hypothetical protein [Desulfovibrio subterraneus]GFM34470.1 hypothetical protein DSM101010T_28350 [Desulfovibrio subterraneus]
MPYPLCILLLLLLPLHAVATMRVAFTDTVQQAQVVPLGINLSDDAWHTGAALTKERVRNGSFEGVLYRQITYGPTGSTSAYQDSFRPEEWIAVLSGAQARFVNGPARGKISLKATEPTTVEEKDGSKTVLTYRFSPLPVSPAPFDGLLLENTLPTGWLGQHGGDWWVFTLGGAQVRTVAGDTPPADTGTHVARLDAEQGTADILAPLLDSRYAQADGEWLLRFWCKGKGSLTVYLGDLTHRADAAPLRRSIELQPDWNYHEIYLKVATYPLDMLALGFAISGGLAQLDGISMQATADSNPTVFLDQLVQALHLLGPSTLRLHQIGGSSFANWLAPPMRRMAFSSSRAAQPPTGIWPGHPQEKGQARIYAYGLHDFLELCKTANVSPWLCVPGTLTEEEASEIVAYLAGPVTTRYGMLRASLGQVQPWTEVFPSIHIEIGNEAWNFIPPFLLGGYSIKGEYWQRLFHSMRSSQWFSPVLKLHAGGQAVNTWLNKRIVAEVPNADRLAIAPYLLHELDTATAALPADKLLDRVRGEAHYVDTAGYMAQNSNEVPSPLSVYEVHYHVTGGDAPLAPRNTITATAGGTVILADWLMRLTAHHGCSPVNLFTLQHPYQHIPSGELALWGLALNLKPGEERYRPLFLAARLLNTFLHGDLMNLSLSSVPQGETPYKTDKDSAPVTAPLVTVYGTREGNTRRLLLCNMDMLAAQRVQIEGMHGGIHRTEVAGPTFLADNERGHPPLVQLKTGLPVTGDMVELPPASLTLLEWRETP